MSTLQTILSILFIFTLQSAIAIANELEWVDQQIQSIKPPRLGMTSKETYKLKDPFIFIKKSEKEDIKNKKVKNSSSQRVYTKSFQKRAKTVKNQKFYLSVIMNKSARINRKWFKIGESINGYKLVDIAKSTVILMKGKKQFSLSTNSKNLNLNFKN